MKNLKKLRKDQLKGISGGSNFPGVEYCLYACNGTIICAACSDDFKCPRYRRGNNVNQLLKNKKPLLLKRFFIFRHSDAVTK